MGATHQKAFVKATQLHWVAGREASALYYQPGFSSRRHLIAHAAWSSLRGIGQGPHQPPIRIKASCRASLGTHPWRLRRPRKPSGLPHRVHGSVPGLKYRSNRPGRAGGSGNRHIPHERPFLLMKAGCSS